MSEIKNWDDLTKEEQQERIRQHEQIQAEGWRVYKLKQSKQWAKDNPERAKEIRKKWKSTYIECECGDEVSKGYLSKHKLTKKHNHLLQMG
ncbi:MAG: hypothetical protein P4L60_08040 [Clostridium sp.]|nr:hypothetical protein [Clostridium sp.]